MKKIWWPTGGGGCFHSVSETIVLPPTLGQQKLFKELEKSVIDWTHVSLCWHKTGPLLLQRVSFKVFRQFGAWCVKYAISILKSESLSHSPSFCLSLTHTERRRQDEIEIWSLNYCLDFSLIPYLKLIVIMVKEKKNICDYFFFF